MRRGPGYTLLALLVPLPSRLSGQPAWSVASALSSALRRRRQVPSPLRGCQFRQDGRTGRPSFLAAKEAGGKGMHGQDGKPAGIELPILLCHKNGGNLDKAGARGNM